MSLANRSLLSLIGLSILLAFPVLLYAEDDLATQIDLPYERFQLDNGLTVLVHSDHSTPTVFVGMWYGVGSKNEPDGKTGFAHLFEHLMFQGSENREGRIFLTVHRCWCHRNEWHDQRGSYELLRNRPLRRTRHGFVDGE